MTGKFGAALFYLLLALLSFFLLITNNGWFWDGATYMTGLPEKGWDVLLSSAIEAGYPYQAYIDFYLAYLGNAGGNAFGVLLIVMSSFLTYLFLKRLNFIPDDLSWTIGALSLVYPVTAVIVCKVYIATLVSYFCFWLALFLHFNISWTGQSFWRSAGLWTMSM